MLRRSVPLVALVLLVVAELGLGAGFGLGSAILFALVAAGLLGTALVSQGPVRAVQVALLPLPVLRLVALSAPEGAASASALLAWAAVPWVLGVVLAARAAGYGPRVLGLREVFSPWHLVALGIGAAFALVSATLADAGIAATWRVPPGDAPLVWASLAVAILAVAEEVLFRGLVQRAAIRLWGLVPGVAFAAAAYAAMHLTLPVPWALAAAALGLAFGAVAAISRSVVGTAVAHAAANVVVLIVLTRAG